MHVFLTSDSPRGEDPVRRVLSGLGHSVESPTNLGAGALLNVQHVGVDALIAVLWAARSPRQRSAVLVEIGVALGRDIPVLLITKSNESIPALQGLPRVLVGDNEDDLLGVQIDLFLQGVDRRLAKPSAKRMPDSSPLPDLARVVTTGMELQQAVGALLQATGVELRFSNRSQGDRADFTLYFSEEDSDLGVVLVEVKNWLTAAPRTGLRQASLRLSDQVLKSGAGLGLLIYGGPVVKVSGVALVTAMSFDELRDQLDYRRLPEVLRRARNESIHGR